MKKNIITDEGNLLIGNFMEVMGATGIGYTGSTGLKYHKSWDSLMPVVEKIRKWYDDESDNYIDSIEDANLLLSRLSIFTSISEVYYATIQFIVWYNIIKK